MPMSTPGPSIVREPGNRTSVRSGSVAGKKRRIAGAARSKRRRKPRPKEWRLERGPKMNIL